jgi:hypothetical protein
MMMIPSLFLGLRRCKTVAALILTMLSSSVAAQNPRADAAVEDIVILRSVLMSRITPRARSAGWFSSVVGSAARRSAIS